ncbi:MAG: hypothetical protein QOH50_750 [Kribbellaceae bacterium]|jgi:hypothetical protein|nr:hypothetical protein [Kribbellaceae bacterium]
MSDLPGEQLDEEPQDERGAPGSRDTGSDKPSAGPADRPAGKSDEADVTAIAPQAAAESPYLQPG